MRFVIPLPPNRGNARGHWRKQDRDRRVYWAQLDCIPPYGHPAGFTVPIHPRAPLTKATGSATLYVWSEMDEDGAMARLKWVVDWIVSRGFLVDDNRKVLRWSGLPDQVIDRKWPRVELTIEEAA